mgnify:CR=1 FL=1
MGLFGRNIFRLIELCGTYSPWESGCEFGRVVTFVCSVSELTGFCGAGEVFVGVEAFVFEFADSLTKVIESARDLFHSNLSISDWV